MTNQPRRLLACFAHPDDETFGPGGTLARYAAEGVEVSLICATRGEGGEIADPALATRENLPQVRERELLEAAALLGIREVIFLDYRDSGMEGTEDNAHPKAYINADEQTVIAQLVGLMRTLRPHVVMTFEPGGGYGHPDHIAISRQTLAAVRACGDPERFPEQGPPWQVQRLFYTSIPASFFGAMMESMRRMGQSEEEIAQFQDHGWDDAMLDTLIDVSAHFEAKLNAFYAHRTQTGTAAMFLNMPRDELRRLMSTEYYAVAWPEPATRPSYTDLFEEL